VPSGFVLVGHKKIKKIIIIIIITGHGGNIIVFIAHSLRRHRNLMT